MKIYTDHQIKICLSTQQISGDIFSVDMSFSFHEEDNIVQVSPELQVNQQLQIIHLKSWEYLGIF